MVCPSIPFSNTVIETRELFTNERYLYQNLDKRKENFVDARCKSQGLFNGTPPPHFGDFRSLKIEVV
jgi:hypothetical protein